MIIPPFIKENSKEESGSWSLFTVNPLQSQVSLIGGCEYEMRIGSAAEFSCSLVFLLNAKAKNKTNCGVQMQTKKYLVCQHLP